MLGLIASSYSGSMSDASGPYEGDNPVERAFAHYHRLLAELLTTLVETEDVTWLEDGPHQIHEDGKNEYAKAIYRLKDLTPYQPDLAEITRVREEATKLGANPRALIEPVARVGINHVRIQAHRSFVGRWASGATIRGQIATQRNKLAELLAKIRSYTGGKLDERESELTQELVDSEAALEALRDVDEVRMRWPQHRHYALLYDRDGENERVYVPKPGVIAAGEILTVTFTDEHRRPRSDRVTLEPLARWNGREIFDADTWRKATSAD